MDEISSGGFKLRKASEQPKIEKAPVDARTQMFDNIRAGAFKLRSTKDTPSPVAQKEEVAGTETVADSQDILQVLMRAILMRRDNIKEDATDDPEEDDDDWEDEEDDEDD